MWDFPGDSVARKPPANAGDTGSIPGPGRSHMPWSTKSMHVSYWAHEPQLMKPMHPIAQALQQEKPQQGEAHTLQE